MRQFTSSRVNLKGLHLEALVNSISTLNQGLEEIFLEASVKWVLGKRYPHGPHGILSGNYRLRPGGLSMGAHSLVGVNVLTHVSVHVLARV